MGAWQNVTETEVFGQSPTDRTTHRERIESKWPYKVRQTRIDGRHPDSCDCRRWYTNHMIEGDWKRKLLYKQEHLKLSSQILLIGSIFLSWEGDSGPIRRRNLHPLTICRCFNLPLEILHSCRDSTAACQSPTRRHECRKASYPRTKQCHEGGFENHWRLDHNCGCRKNARPQCRLTVNCTVQ